MVQDRSLWPKVPRWYGLVTVDTSFEQAPNKYVQCHCGSLRDCPEMVMGLLKVLASICLVRILLMFVGTIQMRKQEILLQIQVQ